MLVEQQRYWNNYPDYIQDQLEVIIVDDCSPRKPAKNYLNTEVKYSLSLYRIQKDVQWNWLACRNLGAYKAKNKWLLLTDMDHVVDTYVIEKLWSMLPELDKKYIYMFERKDAPDLTPYKPHNDSFFMTKKMFWKTGGYDEEFSGFYGTSGKYRRRAAGIANGLVRIKGLYLTRYTREILEDASTTEFVRKDQRRKDKLNRLYKEKQESERPIKTLTFPYIEICRK